MQGRGLRLLVLSGLLFAGAALYVGLGQGQPLPPRWPTADATFAVETWDPGALSVDFANGAAVITREYRRKDSTTATLTIVTTTNPKLFGAGAELPFLGNGYAVRPATLYTD